MLVNDKTKASEEALLQRINRHLAEQNSDQRVMKAEGSGIADRFYVLNMKTGCVIENHIDLESFGRKLDVFKPWEELVKELN